MFFVLNAAGALTWAVVIGFAGFYFGKALEATLGTARDYELLVIAILAMIAIVPRPARRLLRRRRSRRTRKGA